MKTHFHQISCKSQLIVSFVILFLFSGSAIYAQQHSNMGGGKGTPEERAKRQTETMKEKLNLTAVQEPKVSAIILKYIKKNDETRKIADEAVQRKTMQDNNTQKDAELKGVLTADQFKSYLKYVEEMKNRRRGMQH